MKIQTEAIVPKFPATLSVDWLKSSADQNRAEIRKLVADGFSKERWGATVPGIDKIMEDWLESARNQDANSSQQKEDVTENGRANLNANM